MDDKKITLLVTAITLACNAIFLLSGASTTVSCAVANGLENLTATALASFGGEE